MTKQNLHVGLPDFSKLRIAIDSDSSVAELLRELLSLHKAALHKKSGLQQLKYSEWRLTFLPQTLAGKIWTRQDLMLLHKPLIGSVQLSQIETDDLGNLLLFNVLETIPIQLSNLPNAPQTSIAIPSIGTTPLEKLHSYITRMLAVPNTYKDDEALDYVTVFLPLGMNHESISTMESVKFSSNMINSSWLAATVSRPASYVGSWLSASSARTEVSLRDTPKLQISAPISFSTASRSMSMTMPNHLTQYFRPDGLTESRTTSQALPYTDPELEALLDDLCIPKSKRSSIHNLSHDQRSSLISLREGTKTAINPDHSNRGVSILDEVHDTSSLGKEATRKPLDISDNVNLETRPNLRIPILSPIRYASSSPQKTCEAVLKQVEINDDDRERSATRCSPRAHSRSRSRSPVRLNMSTCPPKLEWTKPKSPIRANNTGSSWLTSWWQKKDDSSTTSSPELYIARMRSAIGPELLREMVDMRVHVSTARMSWIATFIELDGIDTLTCSLERQVTIPTELQTSITLEILKILRVLLNSRIGFETILSRSSAIMYIVAVCKLKQVSTSAMGFDLLAGICAASADVGSHIVFRGLSNLQENIRTSRFEWLSMLLMTLLNTLDTHIKETSKENDQLRSLLTLCNALIAARQNVEDRIALRYELFGPFLQKGLVNTKVYIEDVEIQLNQLRNCMSRDQFELGTKLSRSSDSCMNLSVQSDRSPSPSSEDFCEASTPDGRRQIDMSLARSDSPSVVSGKSNLIEQIISSDLASTFAGIEIQRSTNQVSKLDESIQPSALLCPIPVKSVTENTDDLHAMDDDSWFTGDNGLGSPNDNTLSSTTDTRFEQDQIECPSTHDTAETLGQYRSQFTAKEAVKLKQELLAPNTTETITRNVQAAHHSTNTSPQSIGGNMPMQSFHTISRKENQGIDGTRPSSPRKTLLTIPVPSRSLSDVSEASSRAEHHDNANHDFGDKEFARTLESEYTTTTVNSASSDSKSQYIASLLPSAAPTSLISVKNELLGSVPPPPPPPPPPPAAMSLPLVALMPRLVDKNGLRRTPSSISLLGNARAPCSKKNLKPLFWEKLDTSQYANSIWSTVSERLDNGLLQELMLSDFEKYFVKDGCRTQKYGPSPFEKKRRNNKIGLIDAQKAKNIEVMLARTKLSYTEIAEALIEMDMERVGTLDQIRIMEKNVPTIEDISLVQEYDGDQTLLGNAEKYILAISSVPFLQARLLALIYVRTFDIDIAELIPELVLITEACDEILRSRSLQDFLALALSAGNILNASTFRGQAQGFKLEGLIKLGEVRSTVREKSGISLLHYLVSVLEKQHGANFDLNKQLMHCAAGARVSSQTMFDNVSNLVVGLHSIECTLSEMDIQSQSTNNSFVRTMTKFILHAKPILQEAEHHAQSLQVLISKVLNYAGESSSEVKIEDLFSTLQAVIELVARASEDNRTLRGSHLIRSKPSQYGLMNSSDFDGTLRAMRAGRHGREVSRELRDRPASRVFPPPFTL